MRNKKQTDQEKKRLPLSSDFGELAPGCQRSTKREQIDEKRDRVDEFVLCESVRVYLCDNLCRKNAYMMKIVIERK